MTPVHWGRIKEVFGAACERPEAERPVFLDAACGGDAELRAEVERLLAENGTASLSSPVAGFLHVAAFAPGDAIAQYRVEGKLGEGGMGVVYKARDTRLGRSVALKFVKARFGHRWEREARAVAALNHPHIATLYEVGEHEGAPYLAMEFVQGRPLQGPMPVKQVVDCGIQVADALAAAHAAGVVHRDLKPGNILVTERGSVKVLDFGLAKMAAPDEAASTQTAALAGTPGYIAPEQIEGKAADARSDIFAFGCLLYELISGRRAFAGETITATLAATAGAEPKPLGGVPPELDALIRRTLRKDPERRLQHIDDARIVLEEIRDQPGAVSGAGAEVVQARPAGVGKAWRKWKWAAMAVALALVSAAAWWMGRGRAEPPVPAVKRVVVLPFRNIGNDPGNQATCDGLVETLTSRLTGLDQAGGRLWIVPASEVRHWKIGAPAEAHKVLQASLAITGSVQRDPSGVRLTVNLIDGVTLRQVGSDVVDDRLGNFSALQDKAVASLAKLMAVQLNPRALGRASGDAGAAPQAYESYVNGLGYMQRHDKPGNLDTAIQMFANAVHSDPSFALAYVGLAGAQWTKYQIDSDFKLVDEALANCKRAVQINGQLAPVHVTLGRIHAGTGKYDLAVQEFQRALQLDPLSAEAYQQVSSAYESLGRPADAEASLKKGLALRPDWDAYNALGMFYLRARRDIEAAQAFREALALTPDNAYAYNNLGLALKRMQDWAGARKMYEKATELNPNWATYTNLAALYYLDGAYGKAAETYLKALKLNDKDSRPWSGLASAYAALGLEGKSRTACQRALTLAEPAADRDPNNADAQAGVAYLHARLGHRGQAVSRVSRSLELAPESRDVLYRVALSYHALGDKETALKYLASALSHGYAKEGVRQDPDWRNLRDDPRFRALTQ